MVRPSATPQASRQPSTCHPAVANASPTMVAAVRPSPTKPSSAGRDVRSTRMPPKGWASALAKANPLNAAATSNADI
jgi:hypothetical protein